MKCCRLANALAGIALALVVALGFMPASPAYALDAAAADGSISLSLQDAKTHKTVADGEYALYQVGAVEQSDAGPAFVLTGAFAASGVSLAKLDDEDLANELAKYIETNKIAPMSTVAAESGKARFGGLPQGVYLVMQAKASTGYNSILPFVVTLPGEGASGLSMDVDASPKMAAVTAKPETPEPESPTPEKKTKLPKTGSLDWPVPVLLTGGAIFLVAGCVLLLSRRNRKANKA